MKKIRFHADDYGWDTGATEGIQQCLENGLLDGVSIMSTHADNASLFYLQRFQESVDLGLHFTLSNAAPIDVADPIFLADDQQLLSTPNLLKKIILNEISFASIQKEFLYQLHRLHDFSIYPVYLDSHHHVHAFPPLFKRVQQLIEGTSIQYIRCCRPLHWHDTRRVLLQLFQWMQAPSNTYRSDVLITDSISGETSTAFAEKMVKDFACSRCSSAEWMWHPGSTERSQSILHRQKELQLLLQTPWKTLFEKYEIEWRK
ncbi:MAG: ChbG/HpnK family deacetylase [Cytophagaceae bacterium]|jgi:predicted glycoside hydrolase/deacetylase ChbG (UPF0249 family)|nr:ChbG/HpnK family deacetylase [Cytophagaceae bacterium]